MQKVETDISLPVRWLTMGGMYYEDSRLQYLHMSSQLLQVAKSDIETVADKETIRFHHSRMEALECNPSWVVVQAHALRIEYFCRDEVIEQDILMVAA